MIKALNWAWSRGTKHCGTASAAQQEVLGYLRECDELSGGPPTDLSPQAAFSELLGTKTAYGGESCKVATYHDGSSISLPASAGGVSLAEQLLDSDRVMLDRFEQSLFVPEVDFRERRAREKVKPHWDAVLRSNHASYLKFIQLLNEKQLLSFTLAPLDHMGCFFVYKKSGALRLIIDARCPNQRFKRSPHIGLVSDCHLSELELAPD